MTLHDCAMGADLARAQAWWAAWRHMPHSETSDRQCDDMLASLIAEVRAEERAAIVAWLRGGHVSGPAETVYADAIEAGEHAAPAPKRAGRGST